MAKRAAKIDSSLREDMEIAIAETEEKEVSDLTVAQQQGDQSATATKTEIQSEIERKHVAGPKPPVDWSPALKEHWGKLPAEVREWVDKRQRDTDMLLQNTVAERKLAQEFVRVAEPYRPLMAAEGVQN